MKLANSTVKFNCFCSLNPQLIGSIVVIILHSSNHLCVMMKNDSNSITLTLNVCVCVCMCVCVCVSHQNKANIVTSFSLFFPFESLVLAHKS